MADKLIHVGFGVDVDAVAGWLGSYGGEDSPFDISRGIFAGEVGIPRLLDLFKKYDLAMSWFIPGHSIETFPDECRRVLDEGHEIGAHGYSHENPVAMTAAQEEAVLDKSIALIEDLTGRAPRGYTAPWWEMSARTADLLQQRGFRYDHSQGHHDFQPYYARVGYTWTKIDYSQPAESWMKPLERGHHVDLVELTANWYVDDLPPMMFIKNSPNSHGFVNPRDIEQMWRDQFDWVYREYDYATFPITIHPDVSGRPQVLLMLERFIEYVSSHEGVVWANMETMAEEFRRRHPFQE
jgi:peptidoglycan/xylan/chitin deacetylase (PgdA/CDA1 family)